MTKEERKTLMQCFKEGAKVGRHPSAFEAGYRRAMEHAQTAVQSVFEGKVYDPTLEAWVWPFIERADKP